MKHPHNRWIDLLLYSPKWSKLYSCQSSFFCTQLSRGQDVGRTLKPPMDVWTPGGVAKMLIKDSSKISSKELKEGRQERVPMWSSPPHSSTHLQSPLNAPFSNPLTRRATSCPLSHVKPCPAVLLMAMWAFRTDSWGKPSSWRRSNGT